MMYRSAAVNHGFRARVVADSESSEDGTRLITFELRYPRFIHAELMTHRVFSRNASSSRAIPVNNMIEQVDRDYAMPIHWGKNQKGMQASEEIGDVDYAKSLWKQAKNAMVDTAGLMRDFGLHKQVVNRILEPFQYINVVVTATEWDNFFELRDHPDAQPEIQMLARTMQQAMDLSDPVVLNPGEWHLPYIDSSEELTLEEAMKCSTARCARVSYVTFDMKPPTKENDFRLFDQLITSEPQHASPAEHQATPMSGNGALKDAIMPSTWEPGITHMDRDFGLWSGNLRSWIQHRQII